VVGEQAVVRFENRRPRPCRRPFTGMDDLVRGLQGLFP
jgi:hypothetical protein